MNEPCGCKPEHWSEWVDDSNCRFPILEKENAELRRKLEEIEGKPQFWWMNRCTGLEMKLEHFEKVIGQRDALADALRRIEKYAGLYSEAHTNECLKRIASDALAGIPALLTEVKPQDQIRKFDELPPAAEAKNGQT